MDYTKKELAVLNFEDETILAQFYGYTGNSTKTLGMNDIKSIDALRSFLDKRENYLIKVKGL